MGLYKNRYETFDEVYTYAYKAASTVGLTTGKIIGCHVRYTWYYSCRPEPGKEEPYQNFITQRAWRFIALTLSRRLPECEVIASSSSVPPAGGPLKRGGRG